MKSNREMEAVRDAAMPPSFYDRVFREAPVGIAVSRKDHRLVAVNQALCDMLGYSQAELLARSFDDVTFPSDVPISDALVDRTLKGDFSAVQLQKRYLHKDGQILRGTATVFALREPDGKPGHTVAFVQVGAPVADAAESESAALRDELARIRLAVLGK